MLLCCKMIWYLLTVLLIIPLYLLSLFCLSPKDKKDLLEEIKWELKYLWLGFQAVIDDLFKIWKNKTGK